jgi:hypothetical protein
MAFKYLANVYLAPPPAVLGWLDHRLDERPLGIRQIAGIAQAASLCGAAVFERPHRHPLGSESGAT